MKIAIVGPIATENIAPYLHGNTANLPAGYKGAPLLATLIGELLKRGHEVSAFTTSAGVPLGANQTVVAKGRNFLIYYCGVRPHSFRPNNGRLGRALDFFALERECICKAILSESPDVVHGHWSYEFGLAAIKTGLPHVITAHDAPQVVLKYMPNPYRFVRYLMARRCLGAAKVVTAVSPYLAESITRYCKEPVTVVQNPLPNEIFSASSARSILDVGGGSVVAMVMNGWGKLKNPKPAMFAFQKLRKLIPQCELHIYGADFGEGEHAQLWAHKNGIADGMKFIGRLPHTELIKRIQSANVLLHPSLLEGCPMGIAEAMSLGLPIVGGRNSGGVPWVVGEGGLLVDVHSPQEITNALYKLMTIPEFNKQCSVAAAARARETFTVSTVVDMYETQYQRALKLATH